MPRGLNRSGDFRNGSPVTTPIDFGNDITLPHDFGNDVTWPTPDPAHFGNAVTWLPDPAHFGNKIQPPFPAPTFTSATPNHGPIAGGTSVAIVGSGFSATGLEVLIGGAPCTSVVASDDNNLTCNSPAGSVGSTDIEILTDGGSVDTPNAWTYDAPAIALVDHSITTGTSFNSAGITTTAINSTGASVLVLGINGYGATSNQTNNAITITDSKGNTYLYVPNGNTTPSPGLAIFYCPNPVTGAGHTVQVQMSDAGSGGYVSLSAWSGTQGLTPLGQIANSGNANIAAPFQASGAIGGITGDLVMSFASGYDGFSGNSALPSSIDTGFTILDTAYDHTVAAGGGAAGLSVGYLLQPSNTAVNPTWTMQAAASAAMVVNVVFAKAHTTTVNLVSYMKATTGSTFNPSPSFDSTGANFIIVAVSQYNVTNSPPRLSDSMGNTWHKIAWTNGQEFGKPVFYYAYNAIVGAGHTFTVTLDNAGGATSDLFISVMAFSGVKSSSDPLESANDTVAIENPANHLYQASAAITPASAGDLVVTAIGNIFAVNPRSVFISVNQCELTTGWSSANSNDPAGAMAYSIAQDNTTALQPTWTGLVSNADFNRGLVIFGVFSHA